jgi:RHS repeat-associated protein
MAMDSHGGSGAPRSSLRGGGGLVTDRLGSVRRVIDATTGAVAEALDYDEFGRVTRDTNPRFQPWGYAGGVVDSDTKLVHFGARDYDPEIGRWIEKDPIGFQGNDPNLYGYVQADPVNLNDPAGLWTVGVCSGLSGGFIVNVHIDFCAKIDEHGDIGVGHSEGLGIGGIALPRSGPSLNVSNADHVSDLNGPFNEVRSGLGASAHVGDSPCGDGTVAEISVGPGDTGAPSIGVSDTSLDPLR